MTEQQESGLHFNDYWRVVRNRWPIIAVVFVLVVVTAYLYTRSLPKIYTSSAVIKVDRENRDKEFFRQDGDSFDSVFFQTEYELIQSKKVLYPLIDKMDLVKIFGKRLKYDAMDRDQTYYMLRNGYLHVQPYRNTKLIEIAVEDEDPAEAALIANTLAEQYKEYRINEITSRSEKGMDVFREEMEKQKKAVEDAAAKVEKIRREKKIEIVGPGTGRQSASTYQDVELERKQGMLTEMKADVLARKVRLEKVRNLTIEQLENVLPSIGYEDNTVTSLKQSLLATQQNLEYLQKQGYESSHPKIQSAVASMDKISSQLNLAVEGIKSGLEIDYQVALTKQQSLEVEVEALRQKSQGAKSEDMTLFEDAQRDLATQQSLLDIFMARYKQEHMDSVQVSRPVLVVNEAEVNNVPIKPNMNLNLSLAVAVGLVLGISLAFFIEYLDTSVKSLDDVERFLGVSVVGVIPEGISTLNLEGTDSPNAEAYRILRAKLDLKAASDGAKTLTVISGGPGEGKTTTLFNLAYVCAYSGINTLVVDTDFRRHSVNTILGLENAPGLADFLLGYLPLHECIRNTDIPNLQIITSGKLPPHCMGALSPAKISEIIMSLRPHYDLIFFDSPPILGISDAAVIVHEVDLTLQVIQHRRYPRNISWRAKKVVEEVQGTYGGVVLNKVHLRSDESYYYYTSYYGYHGYYDSGSRKQARERAKEQKQKLAAGMASSKSSSAKSTSGKTESEEF